MTRPSLDTIEPLLGELTRFAHWLAASSHDGDEVVQETVLRVLKSGAEAPVEAGAQRAWLFRIARNAHVDLRRRQAARDRFVVLEGGLGDLEEGDHGAAPAAIDACDLEAALLQLSEGARAVVVLTDVWGFEQEEVARILDIPVGTVKSRAVRARARLAALLAESSAQGETSKQGP